MKTRLFIATAIFLMALEGATAQYYTYTPWWGSRGIAIYTGINVPFSKNQYSATDYNYNLVDDSRILFAPHIGLMYSYIDNDKTIKWDPFDFSLSYSKVGMSFTFQDKHTYRTDVSFAFIEAGIRTSIGYAVSESFSLNLKSGIIVSGVLYVKSRQTIDNGEAKDGGFGAKDAMSYIKGIRQIPIDISANYLISDHWYVRGTLETRLITLSPLVGYVMFDNKKVRVENKLGSIGASVTFGFWW
ncbi:MAG: hypothetical protein J6S82_09235 [Bacteroidales bacterium]|nr:hypothetical protein [Bacteroidales bacterium]